MTPVGKLALIRTFPKKDLLKAMNFAIIPALIGPVLGPLVGGYMVDYLSWHWIFLINIPMGVAGILLSLKYMPDYKSPIIDFDLKRLPHLCWSFFVTFHFFGIIWKHRSYYASSCGFIIRFSHALFLLSACNN